MILPFAAVAARTGKTGDEDAAAERLHSYSEMTSICQVHAADAQQQQQLLHQRLNVLQQGRHPAAAAAAAAVLLVRLRSLQQFHIDHEARN